MSDLTVVALLVAHPGAEAVVREALTALVAPTREEPGCTGYELSESLASPGTFVTVERWRAQADLDAHLATPHVQAALARAGDSLASVGVHPLTRLA